MSRPNPTPLSVSDFGKFASRSLARALDRLQVQRSADDSAWPSGSCVTKCVIMGRAAHRFWNQIWSVLGRTSGPNCLARASLVGPSGFLRRSVISPSQSVITTRRHGGMGNTATADT